MFNIKKLYNHKVLSFITIQHLMPFDLLYLEKSNFLSDNLIVRRKRLVQRIKLTAQYFRNKKSFLISEY